MRGIEGRLDQAHDVSVPIASVPEVIAEGIAYLGAIPRIRPVPSSHLGDSSIHFNFSQPVGADKAAYITAVGTRAQPGWSTR